VHVLFPCLDQLLLLPNRALGALGGQGIPEGLDEEGPPHRNQLIRRIDEWLQAVLRKASAVLRNAGRNATASNAIVVVVVPAPVASGNLVTS
jgi:hypothetical protein